MGWILAVAAVVLIAVAIVPLLTRGARATMPGIGETAPLQPADGPVLRVLTLNVAHGRSDGLNQLLQRTSTIESGLRKIAETLQHEAPHVVALQEADGPSFWSGSFDHVETLAHQGGLSQWIRAENVNGLGISFGTAILSDVPLRDPLAGSFQPNWPTFSRGFVVATAEWPGRPGFLVDVVSVHLDFARAGVRRAQAMELVAILRERGQPLIVMGDLNSTWNAEDDAVRVLADGLSLKARNPEENLITFPSRGTRIDWILISNELEFHSHRVLPDVLSDHRAVLAEIAVR